MKKRIKIFFILVISLTLSTIVIYFIGNLFRWWKPSISEKNEITQEEYFELANTVDHYSMANLETSLKIRVSCKNNIVDDFILDNNYYCMDADKRFFKAQILDSSEEYGDDSTSVYFEAKNLGSRTFIIKIKVS